MPNDILSLLHVVIVTRYYFNSNGEFCFEAKCYNRVLVCSELD